MTRLSRFILLTALSLLTMQSFAQTPLESLRNMFSDGAVSIDASYEMTVHQVPVIGTSEVLLQGNMYHMKGNGLEVFCDGKTVWTIDDSSMEVVIEPCDEMTDSYAANPVLLLAELDEFFEIEIQKHAGDKTEYTLAAIRDCGITQAQLTLASDGRVLTGTFTLEDGSIVSVKVTSMKKADSVSESAFVPSQIFSGDWVVTDLR